MLVESKVTLHANGVAYELRKGRDFIGPNAVAPKAVYELSRTTSLHGYTRDDMSRLLERKFGLPTLVVFSIMDALDGLTEEKPAVRPTPKPRGSAGLPTRPFTKD